MKNPFEYLTEAEHLFSEYLKHHDTSCDLGLVDGQLVVKPGSQKIEGFRFIGHYTILALRLGFNNEGWNDLQEKIVNAVKEYEKCQQNPELSPEKNQNGCSAASTQNSQSAKSD